MPFRSLLLFICCLAVLVAAPGWGQENSGADNPLTRLTVNGVPVTAEVVSTPEKAHLGLGQRQSLAEGRGMLFLLPIRGIQAFCMRDMHFSIDIIWIDDGRVVGIQPELSPSDKNTFFSPVPLQEVLEVPGGFAQRHGIKVGDPVVVMEPPAGSQ
jgi:uncharacterized membrane protein (UPF0127 family)